MLIVHPHVYFAQNHCAQIIALQQFYMLCQEGAAHNSNIVGFFAYRHVQYDERARQTAVECQLSLLRSSSCADTRRINQRCMARGGSYERFACVRRI